MCTFTLNQVPVTLRDQVPVTLRASRLLNWADYFA